MTSTQNIPAAPVRMRRGRAGTARAIGAAARGVRRATIRTGPGAMAGTVPRPARLR